MIKIYITEAILLWLGYIFWLFEIFQDIAKELCSNELNSQVVCGD